MAKYLFKVTRGTSSINEMVKAQNKKIALLAIEEANPEAEVEYLKKLKN